jgi:hypothetical protein
MRRFTSMAGATGLLLGVLAGCAATGTDGSGGSGGSGSGWTRLIEGSQGLDNFNKVGGEARWVTADGAIQGNLVGKDTAFLMSKDSYGDFMLRAEFWVSDDANTGIFIRCEDPTKANAELCYEVNVFDQRPDPSYASGSIVNVAKSPTPPMKAGGKWNTFEITAQGSHLKLVYNGVPVVDAQDSKHAKGPFALQWAAGTVKFRKVEIRPL